MYVLESRSIGNGHWKHTLREMTRAQFARAQNTWEAYKGFNDEERQWAEISWQEAHRHVRDGLPHSTALYRDVLDNRIRKARP